MKTIHFLRHAKSSWDDFELRDYDRPLSTRGIQDADLMGNYFRSKKIKLDLVISSPSKRTTETLEHFFQFERPKVQFEESIYHATLDEILDVIFLEYYLVVNYLYIPVSYTHLTLPTKRIV